MVNWKLDRNFYAFSTIILTIIAFVFKSRDYYMAFLTCIFIAIFSGVSVYFTNKYAREEELWNEAKNKELTGCGSELVNFTSAELSQNSEELNQNVTDTESEQANQADKKTFSSYSASSFKKIAGDFYYNEMTKIVFIKQQTYGCCYIYTPYPAPNGLPYRYNADANTLEEINND